MESDLSVFVCVRVCVMATLQGTLIASLVLSVFADLRLFMTKVLWSGKCLTLDCRNISRSWDC